MDHEDQRITLDVLVGLLERYQGYFLTVWRDYHARANPAAICLSKRFRDVRQPVA
jgi:hypothetical protein